MRPLASWPARAGAAAAALGLLAACDAPPPPPPEVSVTAVGEVGVPGAGPDSVLGLVGDIVVDGQRRIHVLDVANKRIAVFSAEGPLLRTIGRPGYGPGEFASPEALALDEGGRLYVLDTRNSRMEVYTDGGRTRAGSFNLEFGAHDVCIAGGRMFLLGARDGRLIHEVAPADGRVLRSFAPDSAARDPLLRRYRSSGYLHCDAEAVTFLPDMRGEVIRFSAATGDVLGRVEIPGYRAVRVRNRDGGVLFQAPEGGRHSMAGAVVGLRDGRLLVQVGLVGRGSSENEMDSIRSYLVSWPERSIRETRARLPRVLAVRADTGFAAVTDPAPAVPVIPLEPLLGDSDGR